MRVLLSSNLKLAQFAAFALALVFVGFATPERAYAVAEEVNPQEVLEQTVDAMIGRFLRERKTIAENPNHAAVVFEETLGGMIDFKLISKRVMGKNYKAASPDQQELFAHTFEAKLKELIVTMVSTLGNATEEEIEAASNALEVAYLPFTGITSKTLKSGKVLERCKVDIELRTESGVIPLQVAMYKAADGWMAENLVVAGVNMGLTLRNQFAESLKANAGSIDKTIAAWDFAAASASIESQASAIAPPPGQQGSN